MGYEQAEPSDADLVCAAQTGSLSAFDRLLERHFGLVYTIAFSYLKSPESAEDLAQDVLLYVFLRIQDLRNPEVFAVWLSQITRNRARNWQRDGQRASRLVQMVPLEDLPSEFLHSPETGGVREAMENAQEHTMLREAVLNLPDEQRELVLLHFMEDLDKKEIARRLGVHPSTVGRRIDKALHSLRSFLAPAARDLFTDVRHFRQSIIHTSALVGAVSRLPAQTKLAMASSASAGKLGVLTAEAGGSTAGLAAYLTSRWAATWTWLAGGGVVMGVAKGTIIVVASVVIVAGIYVHSGGTRPAPPAGGTAAQTPAAQIPGETKSITYDSLKLKNGNGFAISNEFDFHGQYANEDKYLKMYGAPHLNMAQQVLSVDGVRGAVTYAEFAQSGTSACEKAKAYFAQSPQAARTEVALFGNYVITIQPSEAANLASFAKRTLDQLALNAR